MAIHRNERVTLVSLVVRETTLPASPSPAACPARREALSGHPGTSSTPPRSVRTAGDFGARVFLLRRVRGCRVRRASAVDSAKDSAVDSVVAETGGTCRFQTLHTPKLAARRVTGSGKPASFHISIPRVTPAAPAYERRVSSLPRRFRGGANGARVAPLAPSPVVCRGREVFSDSLVSLVTARAARAARVRADATHGRPLTPARVDPRATAQRPPAARLRRPLPSRR